MLMCVVIQGRLETEDKSAKAAILAAQRMQEETERMLAESHLSDSDENDYDDDKPTMMMFHGGRAVMTLDGVDDHDSMVLPPDPSPLLCVYFFLLVNLVLT